MRPIPEPGAIGTDAANPGGWKAPSLYCSSALDEQPSAPTFPLDHGCFVIQSTMSKPSSPERTRNVYLPSENHRPRWLSQTTAYPCSRRLRRNGAKNPDVRFGSMRYGVRMSTVGNCCR